MYKRRKKIDADVEFNLITAMIVSNECCNQLSTFTDTKLFKQPYLKILAEWVLEYQKKYNKAPTKDIVLLYNEKKSSLDESTASLVWNLLKSLSDKYSDSDSDNDSEDEYKPDFVIDTAIQYFKERDLENLTSEVNNLISSGRFEEAKKLYASYDADKFEQKTDIASQLPTLSDIRKSDVREEWLWEGLIPKGSVTLIHGAGGIGKTRFVMQLTSTIASTTPYFLNREVMHVPVTYVDFENPQGVLYNIATTILGDSKMLVWHGRHKLQHPKMDTDKWILYKSLPIGVIVFDTLRSCHNQDENNSRDMKPIMERFEELRNMGNTVIVLHHTPKADKGVYKGSTVISDLCDHVISMVKNKDETIDFGSSIDSKSRYTPAYITVQMTGNGGFVLCEDKNESVMQEIEKILTSFKTPPNQTQFKDAIMKELKIGKDKAFDLIESGINTRWICKKGENNQKLYERMYDELYKVYERRKQQTEPEE